jgi:hypothetical protein
MVRRLPRGSSGHGARAALALGVLTASLAACGESTTAKPEPNAAASAAASGAPAAAPAKPDGRFEGRGLRLVKPMGQAPIGARPRAARRRGRTPVWCSWPVRCSPRASTRLLRRSVPRSRRAASRSTPRSARCACTSMRRGAASTSRAPKRRASGSVPILTGSWCSKTGRSVAILRAEDAIVLVDEAGRELDRVPAPPRPTRDRRSSTRARCSSAVGGSRRRERATLALRRRWRPLVRRPEADVATRSSASTRWHVRSDARARRATSGACRGSRPRRTRRNRRHSSPLPRRCLLRARRRAERARSHARGLPARRRVPRPCPAPRARRSSLRARSGRHARRRLRRRRRSRGPPSRPDRWKLRLHRLARLRPACGRRGARTLRRARPLGARRGHTEGRARVRRRWRARRRDLGCGDRLPRAGRLARAELSTRRALVDQLAWCLRGLGCRARRRRGLRRRHSAARRARAPARRRSRVALADRRPRAPALAHAARRHGSERCSSSRPRSLPGSEATGS